MKKFQVVVLLGVLFSAFLFPMSASAQGVDFFPNLDDKVIFGGSFTLSEGDEFHGDLLSLGGQVVIEEGSSLVGDLVSLGGSVEISGAISGDLISFGGSIMLAQSANIIGELVSFGGTLNRDPAAIVIGDVITDTLPLDFEVPGIPNFQFENESFNFWQSDNDFIPEIFGSDRLYVRESLASRVSRNVAEGFFYAFAMAAIAVLAVLFVPKHAKRVSNTILSEPLAAGGLTLISMIVIPIMMVLLSITVILIPVVLVIGLLIVVALVFGWVAAGWDLGERMLKALNLDWSEPLQAGTGTFVLTFAASLLLLVDCLGGIAIFMVVLVSFGGVLLSRFGSQDYPASEVVEAEAKKLPEKAAPKKKAPAKKKTLTKKPSTKK